MANKVIISDTPHIRSKQTTKHIMLDVLIALLPASIAGIVYFGYKAVIVLAISVLSAFVTEVVYSLCQKKDIKKILKDFDFTSLVTGLLLGMCLSSTVPWYVPMLSSVFAIAVVKMLFGGTGMNIANPAIAGRVFAFISFQAVMISGWAVPKFGSISNNAVYSGATALTTMLQNGLGSVNLSNLDLFLGTGVAGCIGETCKLALIVGGIYLVVRKILPWKWPILYIGVTGLTTCLLNDCNFTYFLPSILSGGLMLGAIFMATDYVTSPNNNASCFFYFIILGVLTAVLREATSIEVVSFAILLMNLFVPMFDTYFRPRPFGSTPIRIIIKNKYLQLKAKKGGKSEN